MDKICAKCKISKDLKHFTKDQKSKDGLQSYCKQCKSTLLSEYYRLNPNKCIVRTKEKALERYYQNKVSMNFSRRLRRSLNGNKNGSKWESLVGYNLQDLKNHLEGKFEKGMTWENYGAWHIDHIRPIDSFDFKYTEDRDFKICWDLSNLQPLWATDNIKKSNKFAALV